MADNIISILSSITITDVIDIAVVSYLVYKVLAFIRETRAQLLLRGIVALIAVFFLSDILDLHLLNWLLKSFITMGLVAVIVIFQPELRRGLEKVGRRGIMPNQFKAIDKTDAMEIVDEICEAAGEFSESKTGALIVIERNTMLTDMIDTGCTVDSKISARLLGNLFYKGSPLHDGAVIIRANRILAASCVLPLTERTNVGKNLGTRHRAALGMSECSDALIIVVSEESGAISVAENGKLDRFIDTKTLKKILLGIYIPAESKPSGFLSKLVEGFSELANGGRSDEQ